MNIKDIVELSIFLGVHFGILILIIYFLKKKSKKVFVKGKRVLK